MDVTANPPSPAEPPRQERLYPFVVRNVTSEQFQVVLDFARNGPLTTARASVLTVLPTTATRAGT
ncbi:hypothetical protein EDD40_2805 [Saccharothrix texasensis]|uniref:Uncharacterized protein n=1 Tax=Saccharothrix texasensis TaxID=103734 RepID=A0A3N1H5L0_9PSEU|nr:hypothetical protein EDD40_2805 [Saccharothrix texasensis]